MPSNPSGQQAIEHRVEALPALSRGLEARVIECDKPQIDHECQSFRVQHGLWLTAEFAHKAINRNAFGQAQSHHQNFDQTFLRCDDDLGIKSMPSGLDRA